MNPAFGFRTLRAPSCAKIDLKWAQLLIASVVPT